MSLRCIGVLIYEIINYLNLDSPLIISTTTKKLGCMIPTAKNKYLNSTNIINTNFKFLTLKKLFELIKN